MNIATDPETERLRAENAKLRDRIAYLERQTAALANDRDQSVQRALDRAQDCAEHGAMLTHLQKQAQWYWAASGQQENARWSIVTELILIRDDESCPADLSARLRKAVDAQNKVGRRPEGWPPLETYLHEDCVCSQPSGDARPRLRELRDTLGDVLDRFQLHDGAYVLKSGQELADRVERWRSVLRRHAPTEVA